ncbi:hypothetical protein, partial [Escherichia coli]|uniref:hypothetical protein n=1 Tax=Escherichia coli TaxID=562 RepID=UPI003F4B57FB
LQTSLRVTTSCSSRRPRAGARSVARVGVPAVVTRATSFLVDFLPILRRTLTRTGFVIDHIHYYADGHCCK